MGFIYEAGFSLVWRNRVVLFMMMMTMMMMMVVVVVVMNSEREFKINDNDDNLLLREVFNVQ